MCGIAGYTTLDFSPPLERIERVVDSIRHRGPDQQGVHRAAAISMGAVRLSIIDVAGGDQPIYSPDRDTVICFNGEIYNHSALRAELESRGHRFQTRCDTEVVLHAFLEWDTECFAKLRGMFACALWCESSKRLVLARDRMGIKPLYILRRNRDLYFGSELKAILGHPEVDRRLNLRGLAYYLSLNYTPHPHTLVEGIDKLQPGHWLEWKHGTIRSGAYWRLTFQPDSRKRLPEAKEELDALLRDSVREHLLSDVPLGVWASGGLDSSTVLHYAAQEAPHVKTFSIGFRGRSFDESPYFRHIAAHYGAEPHEFSLDSDADLASAIERMSYYSDEPSADAGALPVWFLSQMTRRHVTVALSGEGADELFGGYQTYLADRYAATARRVPVVLRRLVLRLLAAWPVSDEKISFEYKAKRFLEGSLLDPMRAHLYWNGTFDDDIRASLAPAAAPADWSVLSPPTSGSLNRFLHLDQICYLPEDILYKCDRMSMAHSLEIRPPFLDHRIVEFAASLPEHLKIRGGTLKYVLRELMKDKLPPSIIHRKKEGFDIPAHHWFRETLKPLLLDSVNEAAARNSGVFDWPQLEAIMRSHFRRQANYGYHLWGLMTLFLWMKRWNITAASRTPEELAWAGIRG
ncbi:MAG: asparagine synthase (glutamine-hydrolyzing) [Bryobacterales bacterium]|nr:asparagine synthase (glutamine-hydrolyzing) [Bryobacterales bacterium]